MISPSPKKLQITARTFIRTIRTDTLRSSLFAALAVVHSGTLCLGEETAALQLRPIQHNGAAPQSELQHASLRPVAPLRSLPQPAPTVTKTPASKDQWKLRWRKSHQISAAAPPTSTVSADPSSLRVMDNAPDLLPLKKPTPTLGDLVRSHQPMLPEGVRRVKYADESIVDADSLTWGEESSPPQAQSTVDVWNDPFGDLEPTRSASLPQETILLPPPISAPPQDGDAVEGAESAETSDPAQLEIPSPLGAPIANPSAPPPERNSVPEAEVPSINSPVQPSVLPPGTMSPAPALPPNPQEPATPQPIPSPSDRSTESATIPSLETGPNLESIRPEVQETDLESFRRDQASRGEGGLMTPEFLQVDCDDFSAKMASRTIQAVSLDISPPFRPDILEEDSFDQARAEFLEAQPIRKWRSRDGEVVAEGRFIDIAFEQAVIETEDGEEISLLLSRLSQQDLTFVNEAWGLPNECQLPQVTYQPREWLPVQMTWKASNLYHKPLYFEEVNLERYGHTAGPVMQPLVSTAHFFVNIAVMPYKMGIHPPSECQYALGYYRPGNCAPWIIPPIPLSLRGAMFEAAAIGAGIGIIP